MLDWLIGQLTQAKHIHQVMIATSDRSTDNLIEGYCAKAKLTCFRGSLNNVAERLAAAAEWMGASEFVRISGDSPLLMPSVADAVVSLYEQSDVDLATNVQRRTFPKGLSVEVVRVEALRKSQAMTLSGEEEHVTQTLYRLPEQFRIANLTSGGDWGAISDVGRHRVRFCACGTND